MKKLDSRQNNVPKAEPRSLLSSNNDVMRGSALGFDGQESQTQLLIEQLADLIVASYFYEKNNSDGSH